ncbi:PdaC/SigV domain-containing protein [Haloimpatiens sp. FM7315]|uniref:PdaC/SigV domain-containing protein n=1 Tax=Haloimpatiens sp. FM7315 TaxID=3298609 RepID=UPI00370BD148
MKKVACLGLTAALVFSTGATVYANTKTKALNKPSISKVVTSQSTAKSINKEVKILNKIIKYQNKYIDVELKIPHVSGHWNKDVEKAINNRISNEVINFKNQLEKEAKELEAESSKAGFEYHKYEAKTTYQVHQDKDGLLSLTLNKYIYTGGAHGNTEKVAYNIDLNTGKDIRLGDLFNKGVDYRNLISKSINKSMKENKEKYFEEVNIQSEDIKFHKDFYLSSSKLVVFYQLYEIAPYSSGIPEFKVELPKGALKAKITSINAPIKVEDKYSNESEAFSGKISENINEPVFSGLLNKKLQDKINKEVKDEILKSKAEIEKEAMDYYNSISQKEKEESKGPKYEFQVGYNVTEASDDVLSFSINYYSYTGGANGMPEKSYYNIDLKTGKRIEFKDLFKKSVDYKKVINSKINKEIAKNSVDYFKGKAGFITVKDNQKFYLYNGNLVVEFSKYEIAPGSTGMPKFVIPFSEIKNILK